MRRRSTTIGGGSRNPRNEYLAAVAGMYGSTADPKGARRFDGASPRETLFDSVMNNPAVPLLANVNRWEFKNKYDINTTNTWKETAVGSGTPLVCLDGRGGRAKATNGSGDNNYYFYESIYEIAKLSSGKHLHIRGTIEIADVDQADWFWGLCSRLSSGNLFDNRVDSIGFYGADGSANINAECRKDSTATPATALDTLTDAKEMILGFHAIGTSEAYMYVKTEDNYDSLIITNLPDNEEMCLSFGCRNGQGVANSLTVGQVNLIQDN